MIQKIKNILGISLLVLMTACQNDDLITDIEQQEDKQPVSFGLAIDQIIETGYEPMGNARAESTKVFITNPYHYIIGKKMADGKLIVEEVGEALINKNKKKNEEFSIEKDQEFTNLIVELRPGKYEILIFTGALAVSWNEDIKKGTILDPKAAQPTNAISYKIPESPLKIEDKCLIEEIFFARSSFEVKKTTDLHTPNPNIIPIKLQRRVNKFRILVKDVKTPLGLSLETHFKEQPLFIKMKMKRKDGKSFASGLDVWGNLWYDPATNLTEFIYTTMTATAGPKASTKVGETDKYYISTAKSLLYAPYILSDTTKDIDVQIIDIECSSRTITIPVPCIYKGNDGFTLKNNTIKGIVLELTDNEFVDTDGKNKLEMKAVKDGGGKLVEVASLFEGNYEYKDY